MGQNNSAMADYSNQNLNEIPEDGFNSLILEGLSLAHNNLESIPNTICLLSTLHTLDLSSNSLMQVPPTLPSVVSLTSLKVSHNALVSLPPNIGELIHLRELCVDHNKLRELPVSIGDLSSLEVFVVSRNSLMTLPPTLGKLPRLRIFRAAKNRLVEIPTMLTYMPLLEVLALDDNSLTELPSSLGKLRALREFTISGNQLNTFSPAAIAKLESLLVLDISNNPGSVRLPAEFITTHVHTIYYGAGAERCVKTSTGSAIKGAPKKEKKEKKEKKAKRDKKDKRGSGIITQTLSPPDSARSTSVSPRSSARGSNGGAPDSARKGSVSVEESGSTSNSASTSNSRQGSQIEGKEKEKKSGSRTEDSKEVRKESADAGGEKSKEPRAEKALSRLSGFFGMSKMHLVKENDRDKSESARKEAEKKEAEKNSSQRRLSKHVQIAEPSPPAATASATTLAVVPSDGGSQPLASSSSAPSLATPTKGLLPEQAKLRETGSSSPSRSPTANMTKEQVEEYKRQALLRYQLDNNRNDALRTKVNAADSAVTRVQNAPLGAKNRARSRHNLVLASIDEWLIEGAKETDTEKAARSTAGQKTDDLFGDLDEFLSGDALQSTDPALTSAPLSDIPLISSSAPANGGTAAQPPATPAPIEAEAPPAAQKTPSLLDALDELNDVLDVPMTPRVFPEPTVQLVWDESAPLSSESSSVNSSSSSLLDQGPRGAPYEKGKVLKQFDHMQIQKMEESVRGPAVSASKQGADGKRVTREVRNAAGTVEKGAKRTGPALPPSGGPPVPVSTTDNSSSPSGDASDPLSFAPSSGARPAPTPTARSADGPPVPPVPTAASVPSLVATQAPSSDSVARKPAALTAAPKGNEPTRTSLINQSDKKGWTALTYSVFSGKPDTVRALLKTGAKMNQQFENGRTCLHIAALEGHAEVVTALLENGAAVQAEDNDGITALAAAASRGHASTVEALLQFNADPNQADAEGMTPLMYASKKGSPDSVRALTKAGALVNQTVTGGITALMIAAMEGHTDALMALVEAGATT